MLINGLLDCGQNPGQTLDFIENHMIGARPKARWIALSLPQCIRIIERDVLPALGRILMAKESALTDLTRSRENHNRVFGYGAPELWGEPAGKKI